MKVSLNSPLKYKHCIAYNDEQLPLAGGHKIYLDLEKEGPEKMEGKMKWEMGGGEERRR